MEGSHPGLIYRARVEPPSDISFIQGLLEAHEGLGITRTRDAALGIVEFWTTPWMRADLESFVEGLGGAVTLMGEPVVASVEELERAEPIGRGREA